MILPFFILFVDTFPGGFVLVGDLGVFHAVGCAVCLGCFIIPAFVIENGKGVFQLFNLLLYRFALGDKKLKAGIYGIIALICHFDVILYIFNRQSCLFKTAYHIEPRNVAVFENSHSRVISIDVRHKAFLVVIAEG